MGVSVGVNTGPKIPTDPIELLTPDPSRPEPYHVKYFGGVLGGTVAVISRVATNYLMRKPIFSGARQNVIVVALGIYFGDYFDKKNKAYNANRDATLRHYIRLHPDDFPPEERKKYADLLLPWIPIR